ncbi:putative F-BAR and double SH3 domains protein 2, partial [Hypsibius exemplaris]
PTSPAFLKHGLQFEKLQQKAALEAAAMDSIRHFLRQKATLEKDCAMTIQKLLTQQSTRKDLLQYFDLLNDPTAAAPLTTADVAAPAPATGNPASSGSITLAALWKDAVGEMQKQQSLKITACALSKVKRGIDVVLEVQREVDCVADRVTQAKKNYTATARKSCRRRSRKIRKLGKKSTKKASVPEKFTTTLSTEVPKATAARNEYILSVAGANAFLARYYSHDLPYIVDMITGNLYDVMSSTLTSVFQTELALVPQSNEFYVKLLAEISKMDKKKDVDSFITAQPSMREPVMYAFEPVPGDTIATVLSTNNEDLTMDKCARKWALKFVEGETVQRKLLQQYDALISQTTEVALETAEGKAAMDAKTFTLKESLRIAATFQLQAINILEVLRKGKVDVDKWMESARQAVEQKLLAPTGPEIIPTLPPNTLRHQQQQQSWAVNDNSERADNLSASGSSMTDAASSGGGANATAEHHVRCVALYDYTADRPDELSFVANQELVWLSGAADDEWILVEDNSGQQGYVPASYINTSMGADDSATYSASGTEEYSGDGQYSATTSWNNDTANGWDQQVPTHWGAGEQQYTSYDTDAYGAYSSATGSEVDIYATTGGAVPSGANEYTHASFSNGSNEYGATDEFSGYCRALFDYSADDPEDLSVQEGDLIACLSSDGSNELVDSDRTSDLGASISSNSSPLPAQPLYDSPPPPTVPPRAPKY